MSELAMLSRVAESIYWMNRYIERAENISRFIDVNMRLMLDMPFHKSGQWDSLIAASGDSELFNERYSKSTQENVIQFLTFDKSYPSSILTCLTMARENARTVREIISSEMWEQVNRFYLGVKDATLEHILARGANEFFNAIKNESHLLSGITDATMSHGEPWQFGQLGRFLERADKTSRILDSKYFMVVPNDTSVEGPYDRYLWSAVLRSVSGLEAYRKHRRRRILPVEVTNFLILDRFFPRSIHYCLIRSQKSLNAITGSQTETFNNKAEKFLGRLRAELDFVDINDIMEEGFHQYLDRFQTKLNNVGLAIYETFFAMYPVDNGV